MATNSESNDVQIIFEKENGNSIPLVRPVSEQGHKWLGTHLVVRHSLRFNDDVVVPFSNLHEIVKRMQASGLRVVAPRPET